MKFDYMPLWRLLKTRGMTLKSLSEISGLSYLTFQRMKQGHNIGLETLMKIAQALDVPPECLFRVSGVSLEAQAKRFQDQVQALPRMTLEGNDGTYELGIWFNGEDFETYLSSFETRDILAFREALEASTTCIVKKVEES